MSKEQAKPSPPQPKLWTPRFDARFPNTNQTKNCWQNYVDYHSCVNAGGENCLYYKKVFTSLCPVEWVSNWDEQREVGAFPGLPQQ